MIHLDAMNSLESGRGGLTRRGAYINVDHSTFELYQGDERLHPARWPKQQFGNTIAPDPAPQDQDQLRISIPSDLFHRWKDEPNLWFAGYWTSDWAFETVPVKTFANDSQTVKLPSLRSKGNIRNNFRYFVENAFSELSEPGEYVLDSQRSDVIVIPKQEPGAFEVVKAEAMLDIVDAHDIVIENISFGKTLGTTIRIKDSENITIRNCFVGHSGNGGIRIDGGRNVKIEGCVIADIAETAVYISGGDRFSLKPSEHVIANSVIKDFGIRSRTYRPGIQLAGVGNRVEGCLISGAPHSALIVAGNDHVIAGNEITKVVQEAYDSGAIYMGRDWTERGTRIEGNFIHDVGGDNEQDRFVSGIYLDYQASGYLIRRNVFLRVWRAVAIQGGRDNVIEANAFLITHAGIWLHKLGEGLRGGVLQQRLEAMPYQNSLWATRYPNLKTIVKDDPASPLNNAVSRNITVGGKLVEFLKPADSAYLSLQNQSNVVSLATKNPFPESLPARQAQSFIDQMKVGLSAVNRREALSHLLYADEP